MSAPPRTSRRRPLRGRGSSPWTRPPGARTLNRVADGGGRFIEMTLQPLVTVTAESDLETAKRLHHEAHEKCFIAASMNFPVKCEPVFRVQGKVQ